MAKPAESDYIVFISKRLKRDPLNLWKLPRVGTGVSINECEDRTVGGPSAWRLPQRPPQVARELPPLLNIPLSLQLRIPSLQT